MTKVKYCCAVIAFFCFSFLTTRAERKVSPSDKPANNLIFNLSDALLILPPGMTGPELKAADMLLDEVEKRSRIRWKVVNQLPSNTPKGIVLGQRSELIHSFPSLAEKINNTTNDKAEGYHIVSLESGLIVVCGNDARGVLFGAGKLLRMMNYARDTVSIAGPVDLSS